MLIPTTHKLKLWPRLGLWLVLLDPVLCILIVSRMLHLVRTVMSSPDQECLVPLATPADETGTILTKLRPDWGRLFAGERWRQLGNWLRSIGRCLGCPCRSRLAAETDPPLLQGILFWTGRKQCDQIWRNFATLAQHKKLWPFWMGWFSIGQHYWCYFGKF